MLNIQTKRVFLATHRIDFRKRFDGLLAESYRIGANPYSGDCVMFIKKDRTQLRAIIGDAYGLFLICRRFEGGRLKKLRNLCADETVTEITTAELSLLLEGATFTIHSHVQPWYNVDVPATNC